MVELTDSFSQKGNIKPKEISDNTREFISMNIHTYRDWEDYLKKLIKTSPNAAKKALMIVYNNQTLDERRKSKLLESNGVGFNAMDVKPLSRIAKRYKKDKYSITRSDIKFIQRRVPKYWKQIMIASKENLKEKLPPVKTEKELTRVENELILRKQKQLMRQRYLAEKQEAISNQELHAEQMELDLFPEGEYHNNIIPSEQIPEWSFVAWNNCEVCGKILGWTSNTKCNICEKLFDK